MDGHDDSPRDRHVSSPGGDKRGDGRVARPVALGLLVGWSGVLVGFSGLEYFCLLCLIKLIKLYSDLDFGMVAIRHMSLLVTICTPIVKSFEMTH